MSLASNSLTTSASPLGGGALATEINNTNAAFASQHKNATRPTYAVAGMQWIEEVSATEWNVYLYDGAADILLYTINPTTNNYAAKLVAKSATFAVAVTDQGKFFYCTASADYDITFDAVATLTAAFHCTIKNDSSYTLTINPDGTETINGETSLALPSGSTAFVFNSGTALIAIIVENSSGLTTGDVKLTYKTSADTGYVMADDGSIGNGSSGASNRANADTEDLFTLFWNNMTDSECPVSSGRGASAAADFAANKTLTIPLTLGRTLAIAGSGSGLTARTLGDTLGEESHVQTEAELAAHLHSGGSATTGGIFSAVAGAYVAANTGTTGSSTAFNVMQPTTFLNIMVKI